MYEHIAGGNARIEDAVAGVRVVQSFTNEDFERERFIDNNNRFRKTKIKAYKVMAFVSANIYMMMRFMTLVVLVYGAWLSFNGELTNGERSEEHTSELQSRGHLVCRLLLEKKNKELPIHLIT